MGLRSLMTRLLRRAPDTSATPEKSDEVSAKPPSALACTPDSLDTRKWVGTPSANDPAANPDCWCWPHSSAMNTGEIALFTRRVARFGELGMSPSEADTQADKLLIRDRDNDDRRLCLECTHLRSGSRCGARTVANMPKGTPIDALPILQRCDQFKEDTT